MTMLQRYQMDDQKIETMSSQDNAQRIYLEAYYYALDLCENVEIAQKVASRFLESMVVKEQSSSVSGCGKPGAVAFPAVAILCDHTVEDHLSRNTILNEVGR